jgi:pyrroloquinoline quinone (PQQ) biosynthesis protein C
MADKKASDAAQALLKSFQETNQVTTEGMEVLKTHQNVAQSIVAAQERNMKFFQGFFAEGMEALKNQAESARSLMQELGQKTQEQQVAFQQLAQQSMANYLDFLQAPLSTYQKSVEAAQAATRQMLDAVQKANE